MCMNHKAAGCMYECVTYGWEICWRFPSLLPPAHKMAAQTEVPFCLKGMEHFTTYWNTDKKPYLFYPEMLRYLVCAFYSKQFGIKPFFVWDFLYTYVICCLNICFTESITKYLKPLRVKFMGLVHLNQCKGRAESRVLVCQSQPSYTFCNTIEPCRFFVSCNA